MTSYNTTAGKEQCYKIRYSLYERLLVAKTRENKGGEMTWFQVSEIHSRLNHHHITNNIAMQNNDIP
jgi:hypothetical protein